jgi:hypothetical protein
MRLAAIVCAIFILGCESDATDGTVSGRITLDGQTVEGGLIRFVPVDGKTQPDDSVITNGSYSVTMPVGEKKIEITWLKTNGVAEDTATQGQSKTVQMIPPQFNTQTTLTYTIVKGKQTKDFELKTK